MNKWFIADTHFSHFNIIRYTRRPFTDVEEMNQALIKNWNSLINDEDLVFFLGDFGLGSIEHLQEIFQQLKGQKVCIRGNHDGTPSKLYKVGFSVVLESAFIKLGCHEIELIHHPSPEPPPHFQCHGHIHEKRPNKIINNQLNLCVEVWNYQPVSEKELISLFDKAKNNKNSSPS
ncbi:metallophosphoesterase [Simkania negevensis]|uniref:Metallophosphoesterase n=1 Tax=Simkania negevensis TaxID=83561 RepID=A0ABS3APY9_9BACT|nr:metallophosphoesterase [Simkania negevensis]